MRVPTTIRRPWAVRASVSASVTDGGKYVPRSRLRVHQELPRRLRPVPPERELERHLAAVCPPRPDVLGADASRVLPSWVRRFPGWIRAAHSGPGAWVQVGAGSVSSAPVCVLTPVFPREPGSTWGRPWPCPAPVSRRMTPPGQPWSCDERLADLTGSCMNEAAGRARDGVGSG